MAEEAVGSRKPETLPNAKGEKKPSGSSSSLLCCFGGGTAQVDEGQEEAEQESVGDQVKELPKFTPVDRSLPPIISGEQLVMPNFKEPK